MTMEQGASDSEQAENVVMGLREGRQRETNASE